MHNINTLTTFIILVGCLFFQPVFAKENQNPKRKAIYGEFMGGAVMASVNYDFRFSNNQNGMGMRLGVGAVPDVLVFPIELNQVLGKKRIAFEYGLGVSGGLFLVTKADNQTFPSGINQLGFIGFGKAGFRVQPKNDKGMFFNFNWNPMVNNEEIRWIWFGLGIGYSWK